MRDSLSLSSTLWQGEQVLRTSSLAMGMPESSSSFSFSVGSLGSLGGGVWDASDWARTAIEIAQIVKTFMPFSNVVSHASGRKTAPYGRVSEAAYGKRTTYRPPTIRYGSSRSHQNPVVPLHDHAR